MRRLILWLVVRVYVAYLALTTPGYLLMVRGFVNPLVFFGSVAALAIVLGIKYGELQAKWDREDGLL